MVQQLPDDRVSKSGEIPPDSIPSLRTVAMPADTNPIGLSFVTVPYRRL